MNGRMCRCMAGNSHETRPCHCAAQWKAIQMAQRIEECLPGLNVFCVRCNKEILEAHQYAPCACAWAYQGEPQMQNEELQQSSSQKRRCRRRRNRQRNCQRCRYCCQCQDGSAQTDICYDSSISSVDSASQTPDNEDDNEIEEQSGFVTVTNIYEEEAALTHRTGETEYMMTVRQSVTKIPDDGSLPMVERTEINKRLSVTQFGDVSEETIETRQSVTIFSDETGADVNVTHNPETDRRPESKDPQSDRRQESSVPQSGRKTDSRDLQSGRKAESKDLQSGRKTESKDPQSGRKTDSKDLQSGRKTESKDPQIGRKIESKDLQSGRKQESKDPQIGRKPESKDPQSGRKPESKDPQSGRKTESKDTQSARKQESADRQTKDPQSGRKTDSRDPLSGQKLESQDRQKGRKPESKNPQSDRALESKDPQSNRRLESKDPQSNRRLESKDPQSDRSQRNESMFFKIDRRSVSQDHLPSSDKRQKSTDHQTFQNGHREDLASSIKSGRSEDASIRSGTRPGRSISASEPISSRQHFESEPKLLVYKETVESVEYLPLASDAVRKTDLTEQIAKMSSLNPTDPKSNVGLEGSHMGFTSTAASGGTASAVSGVKSLQSDEHVTGARSSADSNVSVLHIKTIVRSETEEKLPASEGKEKVLEVVEVRTDEVRIRPPEPEPKKKKDGPKTDTFGSEDMVRHLVKKGYDCGRCCCCDYNCCYSYCPCDTFCGCYCEPACYPNCCGYCMSPYCP